MPQLRDEDGSLLADYGEGGIDAHRGPCEPGNQVSDQSAALGGAVP